MLFPRGLYVDTMVRDASTHAHSTRERGFSELTLIKVAIEKPTFPMKMGNTVATGRTVSKSISNSVLLDPRAESLPRLSPFTSSEARLA